MAQDHFVFGIVPCINCGHMTRSGRMTPQQAPGTRARVTGGLCRECGKKPETRTARQGMTAEAIRRHDAATRQALEAFMRERAARIARNNRLVRL